MKKFITFIAFLGLSFSVTPSAQALISADIMWVIDTSGSMGGDITEIKNRMVEFNTAMINAGIDAHYGLTEFGGNSGNASTSNNALLTQDIVDFATFTAMGNPFDNLSASGGGNEPGSLGATTALNTATYRPGSVINMILVTDEDDDSSVAEFTTADATLTSFGALFNFIGVPGSGNTDTRYGVLAANHGGAAFNILDFRNDPDPFFTSFVNTKVEEIIETAAVPEPASMILFGTGLLGAAVRRKFMV